MKKIILLFIFMFCFSTNVYGAHINVDEELNKQLELLPIEEVSSVLKGKETPLGDIDFKTLLQKAIKGELNLSFSEILNFFTTSLFEELYVHAALLRNLLLIAILSGLIKTLSDYFKNSSLGELGFFVSYIVLVMFLFSSFKIAAGIAEDLILTVSSILEACVPLMLSLIVMSGYIQGAMTFNPIIMGAISLVQFVIRGFLLPAVFAAATIEIINYLSPQEPLSRFAKFIKSGISTVFKIITISMVGIVSLQRISAPILNNLLTRSAKSVVKSVPVVGEIITGAYDTALYFVQAAKSGVLIAVLLVIFLICFLPLLKIFSLIIIYRFTAAIIAPICDKRIVDCCDTIGGYTSMIFSISIIVVIMFAVISIIFLSF